MSEETGFTVSLRDLLKLDAAPSESREPVLVDPEQVLAYLEELARLRSPIHLQGESEAEPPFLARIEAVDEAAGRFVVAFQRTPPDWKAKAPAELDFPLDGQRFRAVVRCQGRAGYLRSTFLLPRHIFRADRRVSLRTRMGPRERAGAFLLEDLFEGTCASGKLMNLSLEGCCVRLERALQRPGERLLPVRRDLFLPGQRLAVVRIHDLPHMPVIECAGEVRYCGEGPEGDVRVGIHLGPMTSAAADLIGRVMARRLPSFNRPFPVKVRRRPGEEAPPETDEDPEAAFESIPEVEVPAPAPAPEVEAAPEDEAEPPMAGPEAPSSPADRLRAMRKRGKVLMVLCPDEAQRMSLEAGLAAEGYGTVLGARSLVEAKDLTRGRRVDLLLALLPLEAMTGLLRLREKADLAGAVVVQGIPQEPEVKLRLSARASGVTHLVAAAALTGPGLLPQLEAWLGL